MTRLTLWLRFRAQHPRRGIRRLERHLANPAVIARYSRKEKP
ncbi:hypothetical protein ABZ636_03710 [Streptomyces sp. NPDC007251]